jgi:hypothetical protein
VSLDDARGSGMVKALPFPLSTAFGAVGGDGEDNDLYGMCWTGKADLGVPGSLLTGATSCVPRGFEALKPPP